eukprot:2835930-Rhodomonas_salina.2
MMLTAVIACIMSERPILNAATPSFPPARCAGGFHQLSSMIDGREHARAEGFRSWHWIRESVCARALERGGRIPGGHEKKEPQKPQKTYMGG